MTKHFRELSKKYGLSESVLQQLLEETVREFLFRKTGLQVECYVNGRLEIFLYRASYGNLEEVEDDAKILLQEGYYGELKKAFMEAIERRIVLQEYLRFREMISAVVYGSVMSEEGGDLAVNIHGMTSACKTIAVCPKAFQTKSDMHTGGPCYLFMVKDVYTVETGGSAALKIVLARNTIRCAEIFLKREVKNYPQLQRARIRVIKRKAGELTRLLSSHPLPSELLKRLSSQLNETVIWELDDKNKSIQRKKKKTLHKNKTLAFF